MLEGIAKKQAKFFSNIRAALAAFMPPIAPMLSSVALVSMSALVSAYLSLLPPLARNSAGVAPRTRSITRQVIERERGEGRGN